MLGVDMGSDIIIVANSDIIYIIIAIHLQDSLTLFSVAPIITSSTHYLDCP